MPGNLSPQQVAFLVILLVAFALLLIERIRTDLIAVLVIISLAIARLLEPKDALSGLSSEPAVVVAAIFVLSAGLHRTGLSEGVGAWIGRLAGSSYGRMIAVIMPSVALLSAFTHHVTTTAVMLPVTLNLAEEKKVPASKLLMPLSFAASLGTTITIIGAPAFLIASSLLQQAGRPGLSVFSIAPIGLAISVAGTLFTLLAGRLLLPNREGSSDATTRFRLDEYFTEITVLPESRFAGKTIDEVQSDGHGLRIVGLVRQGRAHRSPLGHQTVREQDVLLVRATPEEIVSIRQEPSLELHPVAQYGASPDDGNGGAQDVSESFVQAIVAPRSELAGRTLANVDFRQRYGAVVVGLWRREGWLDHELSKTRLRPGDVLVLQGSEEALARVANDRAFLMMVPFQGEGRARTRAPVAAAIMLAAIVVASLGWVSLEIAMLTGAAAMVLTRCVTARQAYRAIDARIYVFIAGAIPLGLAMEKTGTSKLIAGWLQGAVGGWQQLAVLGMLFAVVAVLTQFMSDSGTVALFGPVAISLAQVLGHSPEAYVVTVAMASVASFLTPIGHHGNLLVYGPGGYRFGDFLRMGAPLTLLTGVVVCLIAPLVWPI
jgi:di/tricarboxylate transporter